MPREELTMLSTLTKCYNNGFLSAFVDLQESEMGKIIEQGHAYKYRTDINQRHFKGEQIERALSFSQCQ